MNIDKYITEFDEKMFADDGWFQMGRHCCQCHIKNDEVEKFLRQSLEAAYQEGRAALREELVQTIENFKCDVPKLPKNSKNFGEDEINQSLLHVGRANYNKALSYVLALLKKDTNKTL